MSKWRLSCTNCFEITFFFNYIFSFIVFQKRSLCAVASCSPDQQFPPHFTNFTYSIVVALPLTFKQYTIKWSQITLLYWELFPSGKWWIVLCSILHLPRRLKTSVDRRWKKVFQRLNHVSLSFIMFIQMLKVCTDSYWIVFL